MLYFNGEVFRRLANQNQGHICVMLELHFITVFLADISNKICHCNKTMFSI